MNLPEEPTPKALAMHLIADEQIIWWGRPNQGFLTNPCDLLLVPFSCLWCGFAIFWEFTVWRNKAPLVFLIFGVPFVFVGLFLVLGRFLVDRWLRRNIWYALTEHRALIARSGRWPAFTSINLASLPETRLNSHLDGTGTLSFGQHSAMFGRVNAGIWINALTPTPSFIGIGDAEQVFSAVQTAAQSALMRSNPGQVPASGCP